MGSNPIWGSDFSEFPVGSIVTPFIYYVLNILSHSLTLVVGWPHRSRKYRQLDFNDALNVTARCTYELCCQSIFDSVAA